MFIYIAGPLTLGHRPTNIHNAIKAGDEIVKLGHIPFIPHLFELWDTVSPHDYEYWMKLDFEWIKKCDALIRLPGESSGSDREVEEALRLEIPVFFGIYEFKKSQSLSELCSNDV